MMTRLAIAGYRSLRDIRVTLGPLNVVTGANGSGKSSLYRALKLLADIAQGRIIQSLAAPQVLASDGSDLAAAVQTIREIGDAGEMDAAIADAFPGARVEVASTDGYFELEMYQHGLLRPLKASELSDGTLRYLLLVATLLSLRPPALMILNEPETSLHPDLLPPLARLIAQASKRSQAVVVSHATAPVGALGRRARLPGDRAGEGTRRNLAFAITAPVAPNAPSSRPSPRAAPWLSQSRTSSRRPRGASERHPSGLSRLRD